MTRTLCWLATVVYVSQFLLGCSELHVPPLNERIHNKPARTSDRLRDVLPPAKSTTDLQEYVNSLTDEPPGLIPVLDRYPTTPLTTDEQRYTYFLDPKPGRYVCELELCRSVFANQRPMASWQDWILFPFTLPLPGSSGPYFISTNEGRKNPFLIVDWDTAMRLRGEKQRLYRVTFEMTEEKDGPYVWLVGRVTELKPVEDGS